MSIDIKRYYKKADLPQALRELNGRPVVVFDLETNGLSNRNSVLSCSAFKFSIKSANSSRPRRGAAAEARTSYLFPDSGPLKLIGRFERYYFSEEPENFEAIRINGLSEQVIRQKRELQDWPKYFSEDEEFIAFIKDAGLFIAHNIDFDAQFVPFLYDKPLFCTMKSNAAGKYPKLSELARRYSIDIDTSQLHGSSYDTFVTALVFNKMVEDALPDSKQNEMFF
ncbi:MAG: hypothetical protein ACOC2R_05700 [Spirochaetota bacterium]